MPNDEMVTITKARLAELEAAELWLSCLEGAGVDNWRGWEDARQLLKEAKVEASNP